MIVEYWANGLHIRGVDEFYGGNPLEIVQRPLRREPMGCLGLKHPN